MSSSTTKDTPKTPPPAPEQADSCYDLIRSSPPNPLSQQGFQLATISQLMVEFPCSTRESGRAGSLPDRQNQNPDFVCQTTTFARFCLSDKRPDRLRHMDVDAELREV